MTTVQLIVGLFIYHLSKVCQNNGVMKTFTDYRISCSVPINVFYTITKHISIRMIIFLLRYKKAFIMRHPTTRQKKAAKQDCNAWLRLVIELDVMECSSQMLRVFVFCTFFL